MAKILVVDDEPSIRKSVGMLLKSEGYDVSYAVDGKDGYEKAKMERPDVILLDMFMPGLSGKRALEKIRSDHTTKEIKVIFLTVALPSETGRKEFEKLEIDDYITKPFENELLLNAISQVLINK